MKSLRAKLILPFLFGMLTLTSVLCWYTYASAKRAVEDAVLVVSRAKTEQVGTSMTLLFHSLTATLRNLVVDPHVLSRFEGETAGRAAAVRDATEWIEILIQGNEYYREIFITNASGVCIAASNPAFVGRSYADSPAVRKALGGMFAIEDFAVGRITKKLSATAAGPIDAGLGEISGAMVVIFDFPRIVAYEDASATAVDGDHIFPALLEPDGVFAAHPDKEVAGNEERAFPELYAQLSAVGSKGGAVRFEQEGVAHIGYAAVEPVSRWVVLACGRESEVFAAAVEVGRTVFAISFAALLIVCFVSIRYVNGILSTLLALIRYAKRVSEGDLDSRLERTDRDDELGVLHAALRRLVETLRDMIVKTQEVSRMKGEFLANMSHEIRTPINAIIGMAHLSLREEEMSAKNRDYIEKIQTAARSLLGVINDILDISKIEAGRLDLEHTGFGVRRLLEDAVSIHQINASSKSLALTLQCDPDVPARLVGDPLRIGQILNNLLSNAVKFTKRGGVALSCSLLDENEEGARIAIEVADTGIGIGEEALARLFQPFTQADASITRRFGGTGLGLAITESVVKLMNGTLEVESREGEGSRFRIVLRLPLDRGENPDGLDAVPTAEDFARLGIEGRVILIAEDNLINQTILEELLAPSRATILLADDGREAVEIVRTRRVDIVLMDMQMPVMDGLQATRMIREFAPQDELPVIAVTANAMKEDREKGYESGMNDYITKPIELAQLYGTLRKWLCGDSTEAER